MSLSPIPSPTYSSNTNDQPQKPVTSMCAVRAAKATTALPKPNVRITSSRGVHTDVLRLKHAGKQHVVIQWELVGAEDAPLIVVAGGISANRHVVSSELFPNQGWWEAQHGQGIDLSRFRVLSIDWLGADGELDAPIDTADQADAMMSVIHALRLPKLHAWIGASYGAMVGLQFAARYGDCLGTLVAISGAHRSHPYSSAWRAVQRRIAALADAGCEANDALSLARQLAMLSYRTPEEFNQRFPDAPNISADGTVRVAAEDYLDACGSKFIGRMPNVAYQRLSESIDLHRVNPADIHVPTHVIAVTEDRLVPLHDLMTLANELPQAEIHVFSSHFGHDAFLKETQEIARLLTFALDQN